jgi:alpha-beta hydrolase superfamily lysophospholipase
MPASRTTSRRARAALIVALAVGMVTAACGSRGFSHAAGSPTTGSATTRPISQQAGCAHATSASAGPYGLGTRTYTLVDRSRPTNADPPRHLAARPDRTIPVTVLYPSDVASPGGPPQPGAAPAAGAFPLVLLSHGVLSNGPTIAGLVQAWARAGYVIAAPTYPLSSGAGANIDDLPRQPGDVAFVVRSLQTRIAEPTDPLHGHVQSRCLALAGHSLGAATTLEAGYESGLEVPGVRAVVEMSGVLAPIPPGSFTGAPRTPLLLLHGDADPVVPISGSQNAFRQLPGPAWFVTFHGAGHNSIFLPPYGPVLDESAIAFLDAELKGRSGGLDQLGQRVAASGVATLQHHG